MAWTAPRTWVTSEIVTSSLMNTHIRDNLLQGVGPAAATIAALNTAWGGTPPDGAQGYIRVGATPYTLLALKYDATYGKWVSAEEKLFQTSYPNLTGASDTPREYRYLDIGALSVAGLDLQFRWMGSATTNDDSRTCSMGPKLLGDYSSQFSAAFTGAGASVGTIAAMSWTAGITIDARLTHAPASGPTHFKDTGFVAWATHSIASISAAYRARLTSIQSMDDTLSASSVEGTWTMRWVSP